MLNLFVAHVALVPQGSGTIPAARCRSTVITIWASRGLLGYAWGRRGFSAFDWQSGDCYSPRRRIGIEWASLSRIRLWRVGNFLGPKVFRCFLRATVSKTVQPPSDHRENQAVVFINYSSRRCEPSHPHDQGLRRAEDRADESPHVYVFNVGVRLGPMIVFRVQKAWVALSKQVKTGVYPPKNPIRPTIWHGLSSSYEFHVHEELRKSREMRPDAGSFGRARRSYSCYFTFLPLELLLPSCMILIMADSPPCGKLWRRYLLPLFSTVVVNLQLLSSL